MPETMKALLLREHGGLENLKLVTDHPKPKAKAGSVVIRVRACDPIRSKPISRTLSALAHSMPA